MAQVDHVVFSGIDPVIFSVGAIKLHWYSLMVALGFASAWYLGHRRLPRTSWSKAQFKDLLFWCFVAMVLGARVGYIALYQGELLYSQPSYLFNLVGGGMSFHGGLVAVIIAIWWRARLMQTSFLAVADFIAPLIPIGLAAGCIGNFINAELWGRPTSLPWAIVFPSAGAEPRHPSQLYEFTLLGLVLFVILWLYSANQRRTGAIGGLFLLGYGMSRFFVEWFREPNAHIGLFQLGLSLGQLLSTPMIAAGGYLIWRARRQPISDGAGEIPR